VLTPVRHRLRTAVNPAAVVAAARPYKTGARLVSVRITARNAGTWVLIQSGAHRARMRLAQILVPPREEPPEKCNGTRDTFAWIPGTMNTGQISGG